jgi:F420H(2)-dependent quinone reductase
MSLKRWFYRDGHPNRVARILDRGTAALYARGVSPDYLITLEVRGRRSGRTVALPLVMAVVADERYLVSMLGQNANWVRNVRAAGGRRRPAPRSPRGGALGGGCGRPPRARAEDLPEAGAERQGAPARSRKRAACRVRAGG